MVRFGRKWFRTMLRGWFFPPVHDISIELSVLEDVSEMARNAHPREMLAFLAATKGALNGSIHINEIQLQAYNASEDSASVLLNNIPMTTSIVGTVHSHPGGVVRPSDADLHLWSKFGFLHAIIAEPYRPTDIGFFTKDGKRLRVRVVKTQE